MSAPKGNKNAVGNDGGRPRKYDDKQVNEIIKKLEAYIAKNDIPIVAEFAYLNDITREDLYGYIEFSTLLKKLIAKKESALEKDTLSGKLNPSMAIFSLKQLGWRDKHEYEHTGKDGDPIELKTEVIIGGKIKEND